jgi:hypothetical protein
MMLRRISGFRISQLSGRWRRLHNKGVQNVFTSPLLWSTEDGGDGCDTWQT